MVTKLKSDPLIEQRDNKVVRASRELRCEQRVDREEGAEIKHVSHDIDTFADRTVQGVNREDKKCAL